VGAIQGDDVNSENPIPVIPVGWLLLRDNHAAPIHGLAPEQLKQSARDAIRADGVELKHTTSLTAMAHTLGFRGDFGDYKRTHWPALQAFLAERGLTRQQNLFARPDWCVDLGFRANPGWFGIDLSLGRRSLADRCFFGPQPRPKRAFTGYRFDFDFYARNRYLVTTHWTADDDKYEPGDLELAKLWVCRHRLELSDMQNYIGDQLLDVARPLETVWRIYKLRSAPSLGPEVARLHKTWSVFRWIIEQDDAGWIDVIAYPGNNDLLLLGAADGCWDFMWRDLRATPPPAEKPETGIRGIPIKHVPSWLASEASNQRKFYLTRQLWGENVDHRAELLYYEQGGLPMPHYPGTDELRRRYLVHTGVWVEPKRGSSLEDVPEGFMHVELPSGKRLLVSDMITVLQFEQMRRATGWSDDTREGEPLGPANADEALTNPVTVTWRDACAFCTWKEQQLDVQVRPLTLDEHRELRAIAGPHYEHMAHGDFPWEGFPPRGGLEPAVAWAEPRFEEPSAEVPEFPDDHGISVGSTRRRWISNWPPGARWVDPLPWAEHGGLRFVDAWDAYEWVLTKASGPGIVGRYWHGAFASSSWGEYKNCKIGLRVVIELGGE
jgi:hypothetical protein